MSDIAINPVTRRVQFTGNTGTGPYAFTFNILVDGDIAVFKGTTELTLTTDYTVSINANGTGSVTLTVALIASDVLTIIGGRELSRTTDFVTAGDLLASSLNEQLDSNVIMTQQLDEKLGRGLFVNPGDVFTDLELPLKDDRKGTVLGFNATTGDPEPGPEIADVDSLANISADIKTLAEIQDGTVATDAITNVNTIRTDVTTVSGISGNVTTVAGISSDVTTVAADGADIGTVAGISSDVTTVSGISGNVTSVAGNASNINTVAADGADIGTVATSITNVNTVATDIANVNTNATNIASINTNATNITDIQNASANAASALASKNAAATSATNSANSATASEASKVASVAAQAAAETAETNAETAQTAAETAETNAAASETAAATSETNASTSAATATTQAGIATTKAGEAATSATASATSASASEAAKDAALAALDNFDDRYLGAKASDPTVDNDGNPLISGALYFNTTDDVMKVYEGSQWLAAYASLSGALLVNNNLSDLASASAGRTNLGLGTAATSAATDFVAVTGDTMTGNLDVTGTVTADGLTVDGSGTITNTASGVTTGLSLKNNTAGVNNRVALDFYTANTKYAALEGGYGSASPEFNIKVGNPPLLVMKATSTADISFYEDTGTTPKFFWDASAESLGIGTSSPSALLDVVSSGTGAETIVEFGNGNISKGLTIETNGNLDWGFNATNRNLTFSTSQIERMRVTSSGNVGIGTSSPSELLHVNGTIRSGVGTAADPSIKVGDNNTGFYYVGGNALGVTTDGSEAMRIDSSGNLLIGRTTTPPTGGSKIAIAGSSNTAIQITKDGVIAGRVMAVSTGLAFGVDGSDGATERMRIDSSGNLLVGKTDTTFSTPGFVLSNQYDVFQATRDQGNPVELNRTTSDGDIATFYKDGTKVGSIGTSGGLLNIGSGDTGLMFSPASDVIVPSNPTDTANGGRDNVIDLGNIYNRFKDGYFSGTVNAANFNTTSDATLKTNVETLTGSLDAVKSLRGVSFDWLESGNSEVGVIAQEVEAVLPDVVSTNDQGIKSVKYGNMVALLIEAMKEQQAQIDELKAKLGE